VAVSTQVLRELLDVGAAVDLTCEAGWTPLHRACFAGHAAVAHELVVARKANMLAATKDGRTPILLAAQGAMRHVVSDFCER
jgi:ankyrin repeat protein